MKVKLCPDCKVVVSFQPDLEMKIGGPDQSYYGCPNCKEHYHPDFRGFIEEEPIQVKFPIRVQCTECGHTLDYSRADDRLPDVNELSADCPRCHGYGFDPTKVWFNFNEDNREV